MPLFLSSQTGAGVPTWPDSTPTIKTYDATDLTTVIETIRPGAKDLLRYTGLFYYPLRLGSSYAASKTYFATLKWTITSTFCDLVRWATIPGGDTDGAVIGGVFIKRPEANLVSFVLDSGKLKTSNNPR